MTNVLVTVTQDAEKFLQSVLSIHEDLNLQLIIGVTQSISEKYDFNVKNVVLEVFPDGTDREQMINSLQPKLQGEGLFIARKPFTEEEFYKFINEGAQIVVCKSKPRNKFSQMFYNFWCLLVKYIFGVKFFDGDTSLIYFESSLGNVLASISNLSYSTRVDRWKGVRQAAVQTSEPAAKPIVDRRQELILSICAAVSLALAVIVTTLCATLATLGIITGLLLACFDVICVIVNFMLLLTILFNRKIGKKYV